METSTSDRSGDGEIEVRQIICWSCGKPGHTKNKCKSKKKKPGTDEAQDPVVEAKVNALAPADGGWSRIQMLKIFNYGGLIEQCCNQVQITKVVYNEDSVPESGDI